MKIILFVAALLGIQALAMGQSLKDIQPGQKYDNIHIKKIYSDSLTSTFVIWIKNEVKAHKHLYHTEQVIIIEGKGQMVLDGKTITIKAGDWFIIPKGSVHAVKNISRKPLKVLSIQAPEFKGDDRVWVEEQR